MNRIKREDGVLWKISCLGRSLADYRIVYPETSDLGEYFVALDLRYHLFYDMGADVPVVSDAESETEYEILIGETDRGGKKAEKGTFLIRAEGTKLFVSANDLCGFLEADDYLVHDLLPEADGQALLTEGFLLTRAVTSRIPEKKGEFRMLLQNIWGVDWGPDHMANRDLYAAALLLSYEPDLLFVNEYWTAMRKIGRFQTSILRNGYEEVSPENWTEPNNLPIYYRKGAWRQIECRCYDLRGEDSSKTITLAVLEHIASGKRMSCCCTHLEASWNCAPEVGNIRRINDVRLLLPLLEDLERRYPDAPFLFGADCNCCVGSTPLNRLFAAGLKDAHEIAPDRDDFNTGHAYPIYDETLGYYVEPTPNRANNGYRGGIDHIFCKGGIEPRVYRTVWGDFASMYSDHYAVMMDFDVPGTGEKGETT